MTRYTADSRDRVLAAVDMLALVSPRVELRRAGVDSYFGLCPFHDERTGSFHVRPDAKRYHCFGCQVSGGPFDFVMETEGLDFKAALETLADRFGAKLETENEDPGAAARRERRQRLHDLLGRAATYYSRYLWQAREAGPARDYLLGRGLQEATLREFRVGYAPSAWDRMLTASRSSGYSDEELLATGLVQRSHNRPGQVYDRFRERIMFPAVDARGRVHGFGARAMRDNQRPKYLNTSDGELYHKREVLFGIDLARAAAAKADRMILVEGYTDVLALHQAGLVNAVGIMGTALTEEQVSELERISHVLELCLDSDRAGQDAMLRAARLARARQLELRVVALPEGTDPADLVANEGPADLVARVKASQPFVVFHVERILERADTSSAEGRDRALQELGPVLEDVPASVLRDELVRRISGRLELTPGRLATLMAAATARTAAGGRSRPQSASPGQPAASSVRHLDNGPRLERMFLALCIALADHGAAALESIDPDELLTSVSLRRAARHLDGRLTTPLSDLPAEDEGFARLMAGLVELAGRVPDPSPDRLEHARLVLERDRLDRAIIRVRGQGGGTGDLARQRETVREAIRAVGAKLENVV
ncbi:MAG: DNA primase [Actinomycetota bacterium]|nr:DNA primase [Actinomycetota bacterium]